MNVTEHAVAEMHPRLIGKAVTVGVYETDDTETDKVIAMVTGVLILHSEAPGDGGGFLFDGASHPLSYTKDQTYLISYSTEDK